MIKKISLTFYKGLLYSDYCLIKEKLNKSNCYVKWTLDQKYTYLNLLEILKELKQFVRLFQFFKARNESRALFLLVPNIEEHFFTQTFFKEFFSSGDNVNTVIKLKTILKKKEINKNSKLNLFCLLGSHSENRDINIASLILEKIYLYIVCNLVETTRLYHEYRVYNDFLEFQKIVFLLVLINKVQSLSSFETNKE